MPDPPPARVTSRATLRLWPGVFAALLLVLVRFLLPALGLVDGVGATIGGFAGAAAILIWWLFASRAPWQDRAAVIVAMITAVAVTRPFVHESIANGMMGNMIVILAVPLMSLALVGAAAASRHLPAGSRRAALAAAMLTVSASFLLLRTEGITGSAESDLHWRWTPTPEERLLAATAGAPLETPLQRTSVEAADDRWRGSPEGAAAAISAPDTTTSAAAIVATAASATTGTTGAIAAAAVDAHIPPTRSSTAPAVTTARDRDAAVVLPAVADAAVLWPGFRGPRRDDVVRGVSVATDWAATPPVELWRRPVGPAWSSFAVAGDRLFTQEQRGEDEIVASYHLHTGAPIWMHRDRTRFWESNGGAGPRATPTLSRGRVFAFGATGILNALDARDGTVVWSRDTKADTGQPIPGWGFASSPLVVGDLVLVHAGVLVAYDTGTGARRWTGPSHTGGYSSPQLVTIVGVPQIVMMSGRGISSVSPSGGELLWEHTWEGTPIVQPAVLSDGDLLISTADAMGGSGTRRLTVTPGAGGWTVTERWTSTGLKPYFNDFVVHQGHAFGFDGNILACINLTDGTRRWKGGRYGNGQLVLLADRGVLLVISEEGELALVEAGTERFRELARFPALDGKTWNHPVIAGDVLLVRNGEEMAAFRLPLSSR